jgi:hypothetical protein
MRAVLGIDAAWTNTQPSGVAVAMSTGEGWRLVAIAPSYSHFHALAHGNVIANSRPSGSEPHVLELLGSATALCGSPPDLVAIDLVQACLRRCGVSGLWLATLQHAHAQHDATWQDQ